MAITSKEIFGVTGFRAQRLNPDGSIPVYNRMVATSGGLDITALHGTETLILKQDNQSPVDEVVDITGATFADSTAATVDELVTALNDAITTLNITFSEDATTGRLKAALTSGTAVKVQLYGTLASYLGFGEKVGYTPSFNGAGLRIYNAFDATKSIGLPKNIKDKEEIENETADGSITSVIVNAVVKGLTPVITTSKNDYDLKQIIMGGEYDRVNNTYDPPTIEDQTTGYSFYVEIFSPAYNTGSNLKANYGGVEYIILRKCSGSEGDVSKDTKTWSDYSYNLDAVEYVDVSGTKYPAWSEQILTVSEFESLDVLNV
jgi:hypothetical protein